MKSNLSLNDDNLINEMINSSWTLSSRVHSPVIKGVMALLWVMHRPKGL